MHSRYDSGLIGAESGAGGEDREDDAWMISYLDVLTLIVVLLVLLLAMSDIRQGEAPPIASDVPPKTVAQQGSVEALSNAPQSSPIAGTGILPGGTGVSPGASSLAGTDAGSVEGRYDELSDRFNDLALQGVDAELGREGMTLRIADNLLFASGEAELTTAGMLVIISLMGILEDFPGEISVEGHTDNIPINTPRFPSNWELSSARAISVLRFLQEEGLDPTRLRAVGYAESKPLQSNAIATGRAANRRVELVLRET